MFNIISKEFLINNKPKIIISVYVLSFINVCHEYLKQLYF